MENDEQNNFKGRAYSLAVPLDEGESGVIFYQVPENLRWNDEESYYEEARKILDISKMVEPRQYFENDRGIN